MVILNTFLLFTGILLWAVPLISVIALLFPFFKIRFGLIQTNYIGHQILDLEKFIQQTNKESCREFNFYFCQPNISNKFLIQKARSKILIFPRVFILPIYVCLKIIHFKFMLNKNSLPIDMSLDEEFYASPTWVKFNKKDLEDGDKIAQLFKIQSDLVGLYIRNEFFKNNFGKPNEILNSKYRDSTFESYQKMLKLLVPNFQLIKMGKDFQLRWEEVVDYASSEHTSDFADFFIASLMNFSINNDSGSIYIPTVLRKPVYLCNASLNGILNGSPGFIHLMKRYKLGDKDLSLLQLVNLKIDQISNQGELDSLNVVIVENTEDELCFFAQEVIEHVAGMWNPSEANLKLKRWLTDYTLSHGGKVNGYFPNYWLQKNGWFLDGLC